MSTLEKQVAEAEAAFEQPAEPGAEPPADDEPEQPAGPGAEPPADDEPEQPAEPGAEPPAAPEGEPALEAIGPDEVRKAERAVKDQRKRLAGILGEAYVAHECPMCTTLGFMPELPPVGMQILVVEGEAGVELAMQAPAGAPEFIEARDKTACDWCNAHGFVLSGSKNPNTQVVPCTKCSGNGWVAKAADLPANGAQLGVTPAEVQGAPAASENLGVDTWGRPAGHEHWGVPPAMVHG